MSCEPSPRAAVALAALLVCAADAAAQPVAVDGGAPSPIEQALMEHACRTPGQAMRGAELYDACLQGQLTALRADFGPDLKRLSNAERRGIDVACTAIRTDRGRDEYVACLSEQLAALRARRAGTEAASAPAAAAGPAVDAVADSTVTTPIPPSSDPASPGSPLTWIALAAVVLAGAGGGLAYGLVYMKRPKRPALTLCRQCGADVVGAGDLCASCRHEAAEAQRRAVSEREERDRLEAEQARGAPEGPAAPPPEAEERSWQDAEAERQRQEEAARQRAEETRRWQETAAAAIAAQTAADTALDPYTVLGVTRDATIDQIDAAYKEGLAKYDASQVSDLGMAVQDHYRERAAAVERAYQMLSSPTRP